MVWPCKKNGYNKNNVKGMGIRFERKEAYETAHNMMVQPHTRRLQEDRKMPARNQ
jgi:hypothetical protein